MVRSFTDEPVADPLINALVHALISGPSAGNTRSLDVLVLTNNDARAYWDTTLPAARRATFPWPRLLNAPVLLIAYVQPSAYVERYGEADKASTGLGAGTEAWTVPYWWVDAGAAVENVLLAVHDLELGACFFGQFEHEHAVRERFGVPDGYRAVGTIAVGHPDGLDRPSRSSMRPRTHRDDIVHWGAWQ